MWGADHRSRGDCQDRWDGSLVLLIWCEASYALPSRAAVMDTGVIGGLSDPDEKVLRGVVNQRGHLDTANDGRRGAQTQGDDVAREVGAHLRHADPGPDVMQADRKGVHNHMPRLRMRRAGVPRNADAVADRLHHRLEDLEESLQPGVDRVLQDADAGKDPGEEAKAPARELAGSWEGNDESEEERCQSGLLPLEPLGVSPRA